MAIRASRSDPHRRVPVAVRCAVVCLAILVGCTGTTPEPAPPANHEELAAAVNAFVDDSLAPGMRNLRAIVITVDGKAVLERYDESGPEQTADIASVTKSVVSTLVGIAVDESYLGPEQTLAELLPANRDDMAPAVRAITVRQLLTMTAGFPADDALTPGNPPNWVRDILRRGVVQAPGKGFAYSSASSHLLAAILVETTGRPLLDYAREKLLDPLGIDSRPAAQPVLRDTPAAILRYDQAGFAWPRDPQGIHVGFGFIKMTAQDLAKLGRLFLNGGSWQGVQLVSADWVREATSPVVRTRSQIAPEDYGYQWWVTRAGGHAAFAAIGFGGQILEVVPDLGLVVVASVRIREVGYLDSATWTYLVDTVVAPMLDEVSTPGAATSTLRRDRRTGW